MAFVLVVDDHVAVATSLVRLFRAVGHVAEAVHDGQAALAFVRGRRVDFIVLDLVLPDMSGFDVLVALRSDRDSDAPPVAMFSAHADPATRAKALGLGAVALVHKSDPEALTHLIATHLRPTTQ